MSGSWVFVTLLFSYFIGVKTEIGQNCQIGTYLDFKNTAHDHLGLNEKCAGFLECPQGHYCVNGLKGKCPAGYFGNSTGLSSNICSGVCPSGYYCPEGSSLPILCRHTSTYCPTGSAIPIGVSDGYYSDKMNSFQAICPIGTYCISGVRTPCPEGHYGDTEGLVQSSCSGLCPAGFFCPIGTTSFRRNGCGTEPHLYCPIGASRPFVVEQGFYATDLQWIAGGGYAAQQPCLPGSYCLQGIKLPCPAGYFGSNATEVCDAMLCCMHIHHLHISIP
jgi:hypothetical protein